MSGQCSWLLLHKRNYWNLKPFQPFVNTLDKTFRKQNGQLPDVFGGEDNSAIFQPIELKLSVCIGLIIPQVIHYVSSNVVDHGSNESTFTCFYCILCDNSFRTYVDMLRATFTWQPWRYFARLQSYFLLIMFVSSPRRRITQIISADLKIAITLVVINIFWWNKKL